MKICIAQIRSQTGNIKENIKTHLYWIERAIAFRADIIIFPELSITGYESKLAKELAVSINDIIFDPFQELSDKNGIAIGIGMPTKAGEGINISMLIFQPQKDSIAYAKQQLHADEIPYFTPGNQQIFLTLKGKKIALGICYESLQRNSFIITNQEGADIYIASVAKPKTGIEKAFLHLPKMAMEFNMLILMANCIGYCDDFLSVGQSAIWNEHGELIQQLDNERESLLIYDTESLSATDTLF